MDLLSKFNAVKVESDRRISEADRAYCMRQQKSYDDSLEALLKMVEIGYSMNKVIDDFLEKHSYEDAKYIDRDGYKASTRMIRESIVQRNNLFVSNIIGYFSKAYKVSLNTGSASMNLIPAKPSQKERGVRSNEYNAEYEKYLTECTQFRLTYDKIVDEVFLQLGGFSFQEQAERELIKKCWNATHLCRYWEDQPKERFDVSKATVKFDDYCYYSNDSYYYSSEPYFSCRDTLKTVFDGIAHYEYGENNAGEKYYPVFYQKEVKDAIVEEGFNSSKVERVKLYKNGRVDVKFKDSIIAQEFVEKYLRTKIGDD